MIGSLSEPHLEFGLRLTGLILQGIGIWVVAKGLRDRSRIFQRPGLIQLLIQRIKNAKILRFARKRQVVSAQGIASQATVGSPRGYVWHASSDKASREERFSAIEQNIDTVKQMALDAQEYAHTETAKLQSELNSERRERKDFDEKIAKKLEDVSVGNLNLEWWGVISLILGIILATFSQEFAHVFTGSCEG